MTQRLVKDINPNGSSSPNELIDIDGLLYFVAETGSTKSETDTNNTSENDGTDEDGSNINAEGQSSNGESVGLWKSDGSEGGTRLLRAFDGVSDLVEAKGILYFIGQTGESYELWSSDGTSAGTKKVKNFFPGPNNFAPYSLFSVNDTLFFSASGPEESSNGYELWRWEGDEVGTKLFKNLFPDRYITKQSIEVEVDEETLIQTETLTIETAEFGTNTPEFSTDSFPSNFTSVKGGNIFFTAYSTTTLDPIAPRFPEEIRLGGIELWFSDGTENGTRPIQINKQTYKIYNPTDGSYQPPELYDRTILYEANGSSFPKNLTALGTDLYFSANDGKNSGFELWTINGKGKDLAKVSDLGVNKGLKFKNPESLTVVGDKLYFTTSKGNGRNLWALNKNDQKVESLGKSGKEPRHLTEIDGRLYYSATSNKGREPWFVDPKNKPQQIQDINPGLRSSNPKQFRLIRDKTHKGKAKKILYFSADGGERGIELWSQDLSKKNSKPERYSDIYSGPPSSDPRNLISANQTLFFTANDGNSGRELWTVDGYQPDNTNPSDTVQSDTVQTNLVKNIRRGAQSSDPTELHNHRGQLFFSANNGRNGFEPWATQGKQSSTKLFKDINKGKRSSSPASFTSHKKSLFFAADNGRQGSELWISAGNNSEPKLAADIQRGPGSSSPSDMLVQGNMLYLSADDGKHGRELWSYGLKSNKHQLVRDIRTNAKSGSNPSELISLNGQIFFAAEDDIYGRELWSSDGSENGTKLLLDINPGTLDSNPKDFTLLDGGLYFTGNTYIYGRQILKLDGNGLNVTEIRGSLGEASATEPDDLHASRDQLFFSAITSLEPSSETTNNQSSSNEGTFDSESDPGGFMIATEGIEAKAVEYIDNYNERIDAYRKFVNNKDALNSARYWANALATSSLIENNDASLAEDWNQYYQPLSNQSLSTSLPIRIPEEIPSTAASRSTDDSPGNETITPSKEDNKNTLGRELWISNGRVNGNTLLKDIYPGKGSSNPQGFTTMGAKTYFSADDGQSGEELWVSDGTEAGTFLLRDINPGSKASSPRSITEADGAIYFSAKTDQYGRELWKLNQPGTSQAKNGQKNSNQNQDAELTRLVYDSAGKGHLRGKLNTADEFIFSRNNQFGATKADLIIGFSDQEGDMIQLNSQAFPGLERKHFKAVNTLQSFNNQLEQSSSIIYFEPLGELYFDQNGGKPGLGDPKESGLFAVLKGAPELRAASIGLN